MLKNAKVRQVSLRVSSCVPCGMTYKCSKCNYISKQYPEMCIHVLQAHFEEKDVPFKCPVCGACKTTLSAFHTHLKKNHQGHMDKPLVSMDATEAGAYSDGPSVVEVSVSKSMSKVGATCSPVPETRAGAPGCPVDQVGQCPDQPLILGTHSVRTHRLLQRTLLTSMLMDMDDFYVSL